ncbi:MAG TPA: phosphatidylglycerophosphatase A [Burkholderiales bacterium]|nr:phosphatidylglycerophosphatase A [Burkholderiales bacterium]
MNKPTAQFLISHPAHFIALGFGTGLSPVAAGTAGTLLAFPLYAVLALWFNPLGIVALCVLFFALGVWACARTGAALGVQDSGSITWDEIVAFLLVLSFTPPGWLWQLGAFGLFRFFDIVKPPPIRQVDARVHGGLGVMLDDLLAAIASLFVLAAAKTLLS